ncbi:hypothetical protein N1028_10190 [Herbiconiux sp. CPCC 203407]|uniref:Zinc-ribbon domain-containing protein n=1 Tax=Herbiconiux oxytropis TaxID=2970915 RepID=A0AA42BUJ6_9MICO|nr:hypothetical protein [Herbiconiux oxytropis]MCS5721300.1 hypothetical protein [Herbiconiux oxytropis]MCS5726261.1 hypothetical protein [Herbiconiux oxytropis]
MPENIQAWWERRQRSKGADVPYAVGTYRAAWASYPMLVRQYRPEFNDGRTLSQIPPGADVYLVWLCDTGHRFVATPEEQRSRPGGRRRRSVWCPVCAELAAPRRAPALPDAVREPWKLSSGPPPADHPTPRPHQLIAPDPSVPNPPAPDPPVPYPPASRARARTPSRPRAAPPARPPGEPFFSAQAPRPASAVEADLRQRLAARLELALELDAPGFANAVAVGRPFHGRHEVWPDIVLAELRVAIEYDTVGRFGLEHVGPREESDRQKDRLLRAAGWEVVRIRCRPLLPIGPHDLEASGVTGRLVDRILERLRELRGPLFVNAYLAPSADRPTLEG